MSAIKDIERAKKSIDRAKILLGAIGPESVSIYFDIFDWTIENNKNSPSRCRKIINAFMPLLLNHSAWAHIKREFATCLIKKEKSEYLSFTLAEMEKIRSLVCEDIENVEAEIKTAVAEYFIHNGNKENFNLSLNPEISITNQETKTFSLTSNIDLYLTAPTFKSVESVWADMIWDLEELVQNPKRYCEKKGYWFEARVNRRNGKTIYRIAAAPESCTAELHYHLTGDKKIMEGIRPFLKSASHYYQMNPETEYTYDEWSIVKYSLYCNKWSVNLDKSIAPTQRELWSFPMKMTDSYLNLRIAMHPRIITLKSIEKPEYNLPETTKHKKFTITNGQYFFNVWEFVKDSYQRVKKDVKKWVDTIDWVYRDRINKQISKVYYILFGVEGDLGIESS